MKQHTMKAGLLALTAALLIGSPAPAQTKEELQDLRRDVERLREEVDRLRSRMEADRRVNDTILRRLDDMAADVRRLGDGGAVRSTSGYAGAPLRAVGTLRLRNTREDQVTVTVNGVSYAVEPLSTRVVNQPAGLVNYEVFAAGWVLPARTTRLAGNETLTVNIH